MSADPRGQGLSPTRLPPIPLLQMLVTTSRSPGYPHFYLTWLQITGSHDPFLLRFEKFAGNKWLSELSGTVYLLLPVYYKAITKDTNEHPDEEIHRARSGRVQNTGASSDPTEFGVYHPPGIWMLLQPRSSLNPIFFGRVARLVGS